MFTKEQLEGKTPEQIAELVNTELTSLSDKANKAVSDLEYQKSESVKAFAKRDELKEEIRKLKEGKIDEATGLEIKRLEELLETANTNITSFQTEINSLKTAQQKVEAEKLALEKQTREELISKLTDANQKEFANTLTDILQLRKYVELHSVKFINTEDDKGHKKPAEYWTGKNWNDLTVNERQELYEQNVTLYNKLFADRNKPKTN